MDMDLTAEARRIEHLVVRTRRRLRRNAVWAGTAGWLATVLAWWLVAALLDLGLVLPVPLRTVAWAGGWGLAILLGLAAVAWPAVRPMPRVRVAGHMEAILGRMHNRLITVLELAEPNRGAEKKKKHGGAGKEAGARTATDTPMARRLIEQTADRLAGHEVGDFANSRPARRATGLAVAMLLLGAALATALPDRLPIALARIARPTAPIPPATGVRFTLEPGDDEVLEGEPVTLTATVERDPGVPPIEQLTLRLTPDGEAPVRYPMERSAGGRFTFTLAELERTYTYRVEGGRTWSRPHRIAKIRRPILEAVTARIHLPEVLRLPEPRPVPRPLESIEAVTGSTVEIAADVRGTVADGGAVIEALEHRTTTETRTERQTSVWFDDRLPPDARRQGRWRWVERLPGSGIAPRHGGRAHTFRWDRAPYGFRTNLDALPLEPGTELFLWVHLDADDPPGRLTVSVHVEGASGPRRLVWDSPRAAPTPAPPAGGDAGPVYHVGPLPEPGDWARLDVPAVFFMDLDQAFGQTADGRHRLEMPAPEAAKLAQDQPPIRLTGLDFAVDTGRVAFDRAGAAQRVRREAQTSQTRVRATTPMRRGSIPGRWVGRIPVETSGAYRLRFENPHGHPSAPMQAVPIRALADQPPAVHIERPGRDLTLSTPQPLPLLARAFDDFGVAAIHLEVGPSPQALEPAGALATYDEAAPTRRLAATLRPAAHELAPGRAIHYRLVAEDALGQRRASKTYRLALIDAAPETAPEEPGKLAELAADLGRFIERPLAAAGEAAQPLAQLTGRITPEFGEDGSVLTWRGPDEGELAGGEVEEAIGTWAAELTEAERERWTELRRTLAEADSDARALAARLAEEAEAAGESPHALPGEAESLKQLAQRAERFADAMAGRAPDLPASPEALDPETLAALARWQQDHESTPGEAAALRESLEALRAARAEWPENPEQAHARLQALRAREALAARAQQAQQVAGHLAGQADQFEQWTQKLEALRAAAETGDTATLEQVSAAQQALDPEVLEAMEQSRQLLADSHPDQRIATPPAPWTPPAETTERTPVEQDTPGPPDPAQTPSGQGETAEPEAERDWWDQPIDAPEGAAVRGEIPERYADRDTRPTPADPDAAAAEASSDTPTPREALLAHQERLGQQMTATRRALSAAQAEMSTLAEQMSAAGAPDQPGEPGTPGAPGQSGGEPGSPLRGVDAAMMRRLSRITAAIAAQQAAGEGTGADAPDTRGLRPPGPLIMTELESPESPPPALYRLPPALRQPLLQGMRESGPEPYHPLIDAYFRRLSEQAE